MFNDESDAKKLSPEFNNNFQQSPEEKFKAIEKLKKDLEENFIQLGQLFFEIKRTKIFRLKGYKSFKEFIEDEYGMSGSFASKIIGVYDLCVKELDLDDFTIKQIGFDKLNMIKPIVKNSETKEQEIWVEKAKNESTSEIREQIKEIREKEKETKKTMKDILVEQYKEKMVTFFNCSAKELDFKLALYFNNKNLDSISQEIKILQKNFENQE